MEVKLKLKIKDVEVELSLDEVKELKSILDDVLRSEETKIDIIKIIERRYDYHPYKPYIWWSVSEPNGSGYKIEYDSTIAGRITNVG